MNERIDLCRPCAEKMKETHILKVVRREVDLKITCAHCGKRKYGAGYEATPKK